MNEIPKEHLLGKTAKANDKFYTPKYWVAKLKEDTDVLIQTAHKSLEDCKQLTEDLFYNAVQNDEVVYILIEIRNPGLFYDNESTPVLTRPCDH